MDDLVVVELAEVLHIDLALGGVGHGDGAAQDHAGDALCYALNSPDHVGELAHAGGLDEDAVGVELVHHLLQGFAEVPHQGAADAPGVHLADLHPGVSEEAAVNADLPELVLNEDHLLALQCLLQELADQGGLPRAQEAGDHVYFRHSRYSFFFAKWCG